MTGGTIAGNCSGSRNSGGYGGGVQVDAGGTFDMSGGTISGNVANGNCGGGVRVYGGTFTMTDGTISGNTATCDGGGVYVDGDGRFTMKGGTISGNTAGGAGGGVCVEISTFDMTGGTISGNTAAGTHSGVGSGCGGGVFASDGTFTISGDAAVTENKSGSAANNVYLPGRETITVAGALTGTGTVGVTAAGGQAGTVVAKGDYDKDKNPGGHKLTDADAAAFSYDGDAFCVSLDSEGRAALHVARLVTFHANDGAATPKTAVQKVPYGVPAPLKANAFTRAGHTFTGWNTLPAPRAADPGTKYEDQASVTLTEDLTLYAQWRKNEFTVADVPAQTYTGKPLTPALTVKDKTTGKELTAGTDYTVSWANNTDAGKNTASVTVTGAGGYCAAGAVVKTFTIDRTTWTNTTAEASAKPGKAASVDLTAQLAPGGTLGEPTVTAGDIIYSVSVDTAAKRLNFKLKNDAAKGDEATVTIPVTNANLHGNYSITVTVTAKISPQPSPAYDDDDDDDTPAPSVTVPVSGAAGTPPITVTVTDSKASIDALTDRQLGDIAGSDAPVVFDLSGLGKDVTAVQFPAEAFTKLAEALTQRPDGADRSVTFQTANGSVTLDAKAVQAIAASLTGGTLTLNFALAGVDALSSAQRSALAGKQVVACFSLSLLAGKTEIVDFGGGFVTVVVPLTPDADKQGRFCAVYCVGGDGTLERMATRYADEELHVDIPHLSDYAVVYEPRPFKDVTESDWFWEPVYACFERGIMNGVSDDAFEPEAVTSRAMIVTVLRRLEGGPEYHGTLAFEDVEADRWYTEAVRWAAGEGIVNGLDETRFGPDEPVTREQLAAILYRYARYKGCDVSASGDLSRFADGGDSSEWARQALAWAVGAGIVSGTTDARGSVILAPRGSATRAQVAAMLLRFCEKTAK